jgi:pentatricopeptide repeat protein
MASVSIAALRAVSLRCRHPKTPSSSPSLIRLGWCSASNAVALPSVNCGSTLSSQFTFNIKRDIDVCSDSSVSDLSGDRAKVSRPLLERLMNHHYLDSTRLFSAASTDASSTSDDTDDGILSANKTTDGQGRTPRRRRKPNQPASDNPDTPNDETSLSSLIPPLTQDEYHPKQVVSQLHLASGWNQGRTYGQPGSNISNRKYKERKWDYEFVRSAVDEYERHLQFVLEYLNTMKTDGSDNLSKSAKELFSNIHPISEVCEDTHTLVSSSTLASAVRALTRSRLDTPILSQRIRDIERLVGLIGWTPITDDLSYRLLEANGKAGNVRRTLALLELRRRRGYPPREQNVKSESEDISHPTIMPGEKEFIHAITSIQSAQLPLRRSRNIYLHESSFSESSLDNPTRYLDAILINMSQRGVPLRPAMAARMLSCYASTGRTGRAMHYFYKVVRDPIEDDGVYIPGPHPTHLSKDELEEWKNERRGEGLGRLVSQQDARAEEEVGTKEESVEDTEGLILMETSDSEDENDIKHNTKVRMIMHPPPPFHKIPSSVKGASLIQNRDHKPFSFVGTSKGGGGASAKESTILAEKQQPAVSPFKRKTKTMTKFEWELERDWSLALTAAFAFADSLTHGACGHEPIELDIVGWNSLIKACCYRGAFHRALKILNETMPQKGVEPDSVSYNTILAGLARVVS